MLFDPELFDPPLFETEGAVTIAPDPIFTVTRTDAGTPFTFTAPIKDPDSIELHGMDWSGWLQEGDTITAREVFADIEGVTIDQVADAGGIVSWRIQGGEVGQDYIITCRITSSSGLLDDRSVRVPVRPR
ncbi:hypothetical protein [Erythrobacter sp.]|uniref:phage fiber-tail adaptor protein n=1 Tax=Erythrobacter sp. TaxID=1042 RepID=UPI0025EEC0B4|nr:hypothetical protein [Erythrobacter sp.]